MSMLNRTLRVEERRAAGETARVFHEAKQTLRVDGVGLVLRRWAVHERSLVALWDALQPNAETIFFEQAADRLRTEAVDIASAWEPLGALSNAALGESQTYHARRALLTYHYADAKLMLLVSAALLALTDDPSARAEKAAGPILTLERGLPARMAPLEMGSERPFDPYLRRLFLDIRRTLGTRFVDDEYRTLALWPRYLGAGWACLKVRTGCEPYRAGCARLAALSRDLARGLPYPVNLRRYDAEALVEETASVERQLPGLMLSVALLNLDHAAPESLRRSPFPLEVATAWA